MQKTYPTILDTKKIIQYFSRTANSRVENGGRRQAFPKIPSPAKISGAKTGGSKDASFW